MNFRSKLVAVVGSALILASSLSGVAQAADTASNTATVRVTSDTSVNYLAVAITSADFGGVPYKFTDQSATGTLTVTATDTRGTRAGWNVTLNGTDFTGGTTTPIAIGNLALAAGLQEGVLFQAATGSTTGLTSSSAAPVLKTGVSTSKIWSAAVDSGAGQFNLPMTGTLNVPGGTLVGTYTSTLTVSIVTGP